MSAATIKRTPKTAPKPEFFNTLGYEQKSGHCLRYVRLALSE